MQAKIRTQRSNYTVAEIENNVKLENDVLSKRFTGVDEELTG